MRRSAAVLVALVLVACGDTDGDGDVEADPVAAAEQRVARAEAEVEDAREALDGASGQFCDDAADYLVAVDRYGGLLTDVQATIGTVKTAGADLRAPEASVASSAEEAQAAAAELEAAEQELANAQAVLEEARSGTTAADTSTTTTAPLVPPATVDRVAQAQSDLDEAFGGVTDDTTLRDAGERVNAAAFGLQAAWLRLLSDAGCLSDDQQQEAVTALAEYTTALQTSLTATGHYSGEIDGVYGSATSEAVAALQTESGLPATGFVDAATAVALEEAVVAAGGDAATQAIAHTAAVQSLLTLGGYWTGPIDGQWSDALTAALQAAQTELGVPATGVVDAATLAAIQQAIADAEAPDDTTTTTAGEEDEGADTTTTSAG
jgi:peptidoglycan hydrolase-like protein with peptidoglycan-binding domain